MLLYGDEIIAQGSLRGFIGEVNGVIRRAVRGDLYEVLDDSVWLQKINKALEKLKISDIPTNTLSIVQSQKRLDEIIVRLSKNKKLVFNPKKDALQKLGIELPKSKNGLSVDFIDSQYIYPVKHGEKSVVKSS